jgi:hypothetical protein
VRAEARADRFEERDQLTRLEMLGAVERHVLEEMREAALVGVLLDRAGVDGQPHRHAVRGPRVLADEITDAVRQLAGFHGRVDRQRPRERELRGNRRLRGGHLRMGDDAERRQDNAKRDQQAMH